MFCYQCQETAKNEGCTIRGVCGKTEETANLQDLLIYLLKGIAVWAEKSESTDRTAGRFVNEALFATITNANFDSDRIVELIREALVIRDRVHAQAGDARPNPSFSSERVSRCISTTGLSVALQSRYRFSSVLRVGKARFQSIPSNA